jgi:hypothetical protein
MEASRDVVDRLLVAKGLLAPIRFSPAERPDRISLARSVLAAHDAAELALAAIAQHLGCSPDKGQDSLMHYFPCIQKKRCDEPIPGREYFSRLNMVRNAVKHKGVFPDPHDWYRAGGQTYDYISEWCQRYIESSLDDLDESALIATPEVREFCRKASAALAGERYKESLEQVAYACQTLFDSNQALRNLSVGTAKPEDAIKLAGFGVHANDYLALQEFLPSVVRGPNKTFEARWKQGQYGHPGNWRQDAAEFAIRTFIHVAVAVQDAYWIPGAIEFGTIHEYKVTAIADNVEVVGETRKSFVDMPKPGVVRTLQKGESILCREVQGTAWYLSRLFGGEEKKPTLLITGSPYGSPTGEVEQDKVRVTCVPRKDGFVQEYFPNLREVDYKP